MYVSEICSYGVANRSVARPISDIEKNTASFTGVCFGVTLIVTLRIVLIELKLLPPCARVILYKTAHIFISVGILLRCVRCWQYLLANVLHSEAWEKKDTILSWYAISRNVRTSVHASWYVSDTNRDILFHL